ncbi:serine acetyltransferase [Nocardioides sp. IC4_145]|uniref:serine O-acetyltransferase n=1 Tax=Nocardioides sp. IC4_145 TaxID=2714037 RepID=UPI00140B60EE|nr:serine acetyltransferase [Nocardioides sp. IC4_145]NHC23862.1 serine acetyltransferase [Nocardioides sp. IC4_145]
MTISHLGVFLYRLSHRLGGRLPLLGLLIKQLNHMVTGADIAWQAKIGHDLRLFHPTGVVIGKYVTIGSGCRIQQGVTIGGTGDDDARPGESPQIGDRVRIGPGAKLFGAIIVGDDSRIGANAVVLKDVPKAHSAVGVPASMRPRLPTIGG